MSFVMARVDLLRWSGCDGLSGIAGLHSEAEEAQHSTRRSRCQVAKGVGGGAALSHGWLAEEEHGLLRSCVKGRWCV